MPYTITGQMYLGCAITMAAETAKEAVEVARLRLADGLMTG